MLYCLFEAGRNLLDTFSAGWIGQTGSSAVLCDLPKEFPGLCLEKLYRHGGMRDSEDVRSHSVNAGKEGE